MLAEWTFADFLWGMLVFFFWFMAIWIFIAVFADIFRRHDLSGWAKVGWIVLIFILPFLGALIYISTRPSEMTAPAQGDDAGMRVATSGGPEGR